MKQEYPVLALALGEYLEEMINCTSQIYLFTKYEKKLKKLMGYSSNAVIRLTNDDDDDVTEEYDSSVNGTYRREATKIGRNDPCTCGSGKNIRSVVGNDRTVTGGRGCCHW